MTDLPKTFDTAAIESRWYPHWEENGLFRPHRPGAEPFTIVIPPPNVTGSLHIGHALDVTLQDILVRHARLKGQDALWVVGTDHAGIATQMVVERQMNARGEKRTDLTREAFVEKVWEWKAESGGTITRQLRRLGASCDWANEKFTMDPHFSKAVTHVFVKLYEEGLLYRDKRLVNWDPGLKTAISDLEVETREVQGKFWHLRYPLEDGSGYIAVATTRPETMLADMAVAVHPTDERYMDLVGRKVRLPITGRLIPIVADEHADPELGSGAVKITPGHDFNDFEVGRRAGIAAADMLNMLDAEAQVVQVSDGLIPADYLGLDRFEARRLLIERLEANGTLTQVEDRTIQTPFGDRSGAVIEPWLTDQWYVDAETLAGPAIDAVRDGRIKVVPETWAKTWFNWLENIQPWCVSRQLWWGHRIPAWYGAKREGYDSADHDRMMVGPAFALVDGHTIVARDEGEAKQRFAAYYGVEINQIQVATRESEGWSGTGGGRSIYRDEDVLDTWFSSALWPFATLGWPDADHPRPGEGGHPQDGGGGVLLGADPDRAPPPLSASRTVPLPGTGKILGGRYPNDILISGFDILFFWDARMAMQGLHFLEDVPFKTLYLHGLVRDATGAKMSKSKGNTVDPLGLIDRYGADALRFTLAAMESQGRDIKLDEKRVEGYRNFATKLWNAARFLAANGVGPSGSLEAPPAQAPVNRWIIAETIDCVQALDIALADLRFDEAANTLYQFVWSRFCDWYIELVKPVSSEVERGQVDEETKAVAGWAFDQILVMLHPFMPFITEELWHAGGRTSDLITARWPRADARALDPEAAKEIRRLIEIIQDIRAQRNEAEVPPSAILPVSILIDEAEELDFFNRYIFRLRQLARIQPAKLSYDPAENGMAAGWGSELTERFGPPADGFQLGPITFQLNAGPLTLVANVRGFIDLDEQRASKKKALFAAEKERDGLAGRLSNPSFVERAKPEAVEKARADHAEKAAEAERLGAALARLG